MSEAAVLLDSPTVESRWEVTGPARDVVVASLLCGRHHAYNVPVLLKLARCADPDGFATALQGLVDRTPLLHTRFRREGRVIWAMRDASPRVEQARCAAAEVAEWSRQNRIDVLDPCLARFVVLTHPDSAEVDVLVNIHHALLDGTSLMTFLRAACSAYLGDDMAPMLDADPAGAAPASAPVGSPRRAPTPVLIGCEAITDGAIAPFLSGLARLGDRDQVPVGAVYHATIAASATFAFSLRAAAVALADATGSDVVALGVASLGRGPRDIRRLGQRVRLRPIVLVPRSLDVDAAKTLGIQLTVESMTSRGPLTSTESAAATSVVFDYKGASMSGEGICDELGARVEDDPTYLDPKYPLHFCVEQTPQGQRLALTSQHIPAERLAAVVTAYRAALAATPHQPLAPFAHHVPHGTGANQSP